MENKKITLSEKIPILFVIIHFAFSIYFIGMLIYGLFINEITPTFLFIEAVFFLLILYSLDIQLNIYYAEIDEEFLYLKGFFRKQKIELTQIKKVRQHFGVRRPHEKLIKVILHKNYGLFSRIFIFPNDNLNYGEKVRNKNFILLRKYIEQAKNRKN